MPASCEFLYHTCELHLLLQEAAIIKAAVNVLDMRQINAMSNASLL